MGKTSIEWASDSWNPIRARYWEIQDDGSGKERIGWHCEHVSPGCVNCYAETMNIWRGTGQDFKPGVRRRVNKFGETVGEVEVFLDEKMLTQPLRWKRPRMIFVCSMTDLFADFVTDEMLDKIFAVMALCPQHTFQCLTKRPERMRAYLSDGEVNLRIAVASVDLPCRDELVRVPSIPLANCWLGVSCEDQTRADERIPELLATPAAVRWVSAEPLLGPIDFAKWLAVRQTAPDAMTWALGLGKDTRLDWIVAGGESGPGARPMHPEWAMSIRDQCAEAGVAFLFKQWGAWVPGVVYSVDNEGGFTRHQDPAQGAFPGRRSHWWNGDAFGGVISTLVGKKAAGRLLDGRTHDEYPR